MYMYIDIVRVGQKGRWSKGTSVRRTVCYRHYKQIFLTAPFQFITGIVQSSISPRLFLIPEHGLSIASVLKFGIFYVTIVYMC